MEISHLDDPCITNKITDYKNDQSKMMNKEVPR